MKSKINWAVVILIVLAALSRLIPHPPNFTPLVALALFGGAWLQDKRLALIVPLLALLLTDLFLGFHKTMIFVYSAFVLIAGVGFWLEKNRKTVYIASAALLSTLLFFVVTNFGVWLVSDYYDASGAGLVQCFVAAIPFLQNTVASTLLYSLVLFGSAEMASRGFTRLVHKN